MLVAQVVAGTFVAAQLVSQLAQERLVSQLAELEDAWAFWVHEVWEQQVVALGAWQGLVSQLPALGVCAVPVVFRLSRDQRHEAVSPQQ